MTNHSTTTCFINRQNIVVRDYFHDLKHNTRTLTSDQEAQLSRRITEGDEMAIKELVEANLLFVVSEAMKLTANSTVSFEDLVCEGNIGMMEAARRFDASHGTRFITYAKAWVNRYMVDAIKKDLKQREHTSSYNNPLGHEDEGSCTFEDFLADCNLTTADEDLDIELRFATLSNAISNNLTERQQYIIRKEFGIDCNPMSVNDISKALGVSRETVRIDKQKAFSILRKAVTAVA